MNRYVERVIGIRFERIAPIRTLARARCPVLLVHGRQDGTVPVDDARLLWRRRGAAVVTLIECNGTHEGFDDLDEVTRQILEFLAASSHSAACAPHILPTENP